MTSWIYWANTSLQHRIDTEVLFERRTPLLFIDIGVLLAYFILVRSAEIPARVGDTPVASAIPELKWLIVIGVMYLVWDAWLQFVVGENDRFPLFKTRFFNTSSWARIAGTAIFVGGLVGMMKCIRYFDSQITVAAVDGALACWLLAYRAMQSRHAVTAIGFASATIALTVWALGMSIH